MVLIIICCHVHTGSAVCVPPTDATGNGLTNGEVDLATSDVSLNITLWDETAACMSYDCRPIVCPVGR